MALAYFTPFAVVPLCCTPHFGLTLNPFPPFPTPHTTRPHVRTRALVDVCENDPRAQVYFRYLILNGRAHYPHLFTSQQTWLLVTLQLAMVAVQLACFLALGSGMSAAQAAFMATTTRHAGFVALNLNRQSTAVLLLLLLVMFLAPT